MRTMLNCKRLFLIFRHLNGMYFIGSNEQVRLDNDNHHIMEIRTRVKASWGRGTSFQQ